MRFLLINYEYPPIGAGAANATFHLARELVDLGHGAVVVSAGFGGLRGWASEDGVSVYRCPCRRRLATRAGLWEMASFLVSARARMARVLSRAGRFDGAIIFFSLPCGLLGPFLNRRSGIPYVISLRGGDVPGSEPSLAWLYWMTALLRRRVLRGSLAVVANSVGLAARAEQADPVPVEVIPNGVDTDFFKPGSAARDEGAVRFLFVGRFHPQKNLDDLLDRFATLRHEIEVPVELVLVGAGPLAAALQARAERLGLGEGFRVVDWCGREALRRQYQAADCLVNLSAYEGMPNAVLEGMACGLPVVASDIGGHEMLVEDEVNGFLVPLSQPERVVARLKWICEHREQSALMGQRSRDKAVARFSWATMAQSYVRLFAQDGSRGLVR